jgi:hypothetical protein
MDVYKLDWRCPAWDICMGELYDHEAIEPAEGRGFYSEVFSPFSICPPSTVEAAACPSVDLKPWKYYRRVSAVSSGSASTRCHPTFFLKSFRSFALTPLAVALTLSPSPPLAARQISSSRFRR